MTSGFKLIKGKKGIQGVDMFFVIVLILAFAVVTLLALKMNNEFISAITGTSLDTQMTREITASGSTGLGMFDNMFPFIIIGLTLAIGVSAFFVETHPFFLIISIFLWIMSVVFAFQVQKVYQEISSTSALATEVASLSIFSLVFSKFGLIIAVCVFVIIILLYGKRGSSEM